MDTSGNKEKVRGISDLFPSIYVLIMVNLSDEFPCLISNELLKENELYQENEEKDDHRKTKSHVMMDYRPGSSDADVNTSPISVLPYESMLLLDMKYGITTQKNSSTEEGLKPRSGKFLLYTSFMIYLYSLVVHESSAYVTPILFICLCTVQIFFCATQFMHEANHDVAAILWNIQHAVETRFHFFILCFVLA